jgi:hypothetical protein
MAVSKNVSDVKLRLRFPNGLTSGGKAKYKTVNLSNVKLDVTDEALYEAGNAYAGLVNGELESVSRVDVSDMTSAD